MAVKITALTQFRVEIESENGSVEFRHVYAKSAQAAEKIVQAEMKSRQ